MEYRPRHVLDHHSCLDRPLSRPANGEDPVILHEDGGTIPNRPNDFPANSIPANFCILAHRDLAAKLITDGCEYSRDRASHRGPRSRKVAMGVNDSVHVRPVPIYVDV